MSCSTSRGINDNRTTVQILATRIFDNIRIDLDREPLILSATIPYNNNEITPLYASGTGTLCVATILSISPRYDGNNADVTGNLELSGVLTYIYNGASYTAPCVITMPYAAKMTLPENALWPYEITIHYCFFADNIKLENDNFASTVDGTVICYVTSQTPMSVLYAGPIEYNSVSNRQILPQNTFIYSSFYPSNSNNG